MFALCTISAFAQSQTTGRIAGTVRDPNGAVIVGAEVTVTSLATADERKVYDRQEGNYAVPLLSPGTYRMRVAANGFNPDLFDVCPGGHHRNYDSQRATHGRGIIVDPVTVRAAPLVRADGPQLGRVVDSRAVAELPLATRNFMQILALSTGTFADLPTTRPLGRNSQSVSVNGARTHAEQFRDQRH